ncbi:MAG: hypothetical protein PWP64_331 [Candidatus Cloacimonadota bacterium]|jgi:flavin reductase (DIM6/NTAB) family NADH-FMN oxidoreductase RutF|nr:hypothetical protein [Candidatus Cloacimonadota bacterium]
MMKLKTLPEAYAKVHIPSKVALAVTKKPDGKFNLITLEWFMRTSIAPPMFAISIGQTRYSHACLQENRYFNLVFPSLKNKELLTLSGSQSGREIDKFRVGEVEYIPGKLQKYPIITSAVACFECEVVTQVKSGDHTIFVGEVKYNWLNSEEEFFYFDKK